MCSTPALVKAVTMGHSIIITVTIILVMMLKSMLIF